MYEAHFGLIRRPFGETVDPSAYVPLSTHEAVLRQDENRQNALLAEVAQQFVHLQRQETLVGHRVHVAVQAVDDHDGRRFLLDGLADDHGELAWGKLRRIDLLEMQQTLLDGLLQR